MAEAELVASIGESMMDGAERVQTSASVGILGEGRQPGS